MPATTIQLFRDVDDGVPLLDWLDDLETSDPRAYRKCLQRILLLAQLGNELRRPYSDLLRDGIRELRAKVGTVNFRILYFFHGPNVVCLSHGFTKEGVVPAVEIDVAVARKLLVEGDAETYTTDFEV